MRVVSIVLVLLLVLGIVTGGGWLIWHELPTWSDRGNFGQMFGPIETLLSGLALVGVVYALILQRDELRLQHDDLIASQADLARSSRAQEAAMLALRDQVQALQQTARIESMNALLPLLRERIAKVPHGARGSEAFERLVLQAEQLEDALAQTANELITAKKGEGLQPVTGSASVDAT